MGRMVARFLFICLSFAPFCAQAARVQNDHLGPFPDHLGPFPDNFGLFPDLPLTSHDLFTDLP